MPRTGHKREETAEAMQVYAARARDTELLREATEIKVKAERVVGQKCWSLWANRVNGKGAASRQMYLGDTFKLPDLQITRLQSSRWQRLANLDEQAFTERLDRTVRKAIAAASVAGNLVRKART